MIGITFFKILNSHVHGKRLHSILFRKYLKKVHLYSSLVFFFLRGGGGGQKLKGSKTKKNLKCFKHKKIFFIYVFFFFFGGGGGGSKMIKVTKPREYVNVFSMFCFYSLYTKQILYILEFDIFQNWNMESTLKSKLCNLQKRKFLHYECNT